MKASILSSLPESAITSVWGTGTDGEFDNIVWGTSVLDYDITWDPDPIDIDPATIQLTVSTVFAVGEQR